MPPERFDQEERGGVPPLLILAMVGAGVLLFARRSGAAPVIGARLFCPSAPLPANTLQSILFQWGNSARQSKTLRAVVSVAGQEVYANTATLEPRQVAEDVAVFTTIELLPGQSITQPVRLAVYDGTQLVASDTCSITVMESGDATLQIQQVRVVAVEQQ